MAGSAENVANGPVLDVRGLASPENILTVLKKASELPRGGTLEVCLDSNPFQLYDLLQQRGYFLEMLPQGDGTYRGRVKQRDIAALSH